MKFDTEFALRPTEPFFFPNDSMIAEAFARKEESLKSLAVNFFEFDAPHDIEYAFELDNEMIFERDGC